MTSIISLNNELSSYYSLFSINFFSFKSRQDDKGAEDLPMVPVLLKKTVKSKENRGRQNGGQVRSFYPRKTRFQRFNQLPVLT